MYTLYTIHRNCIEPNTLYKIDLYLWPGNGMIFVVLLNAYVFSIQNAEIHFRWLMDCDSFRILLLFNPSFTLIRFLLFCFFSKVCMPFSLHFVLWKIAYYKWIGNCSKFYSLTKKTTSFVVIRMTQTIRIENLKI